LISIYEERIELLVGSLNMLYDTQMTRLKIQLHLTCTARDSTDFTIWHI